MILRAQFDKWTENLRASYWFIPAMMALGAGLLAFAATTIDHLLAPDWRQGGNVLAATSPDGARAILSVIGGSMIGVAGIVFSVTMAAVVYASGQYGPRLLTNFLSDRGNQVTLGTFIATFVFSVLVLGAVRSPDEGVDGMGDGFVPHVALVLAVVLALCSIAVLIYFIHHVPTRIHISEVIAGIGEALLSAIDERFPKKIGTGARDRSELEDAWWQLPPAFRPGSDRGEGDVDYGEVRAQERGYIQFLDEKTLMDAARRHAVIVRLAIRPGTFLFEGSLVCDVWPAERLTDDCRRDILASIATGGRRTPADDMLFLVDELVEITARALSPSVNDPFTAVNCIDWIGAALAALARRQTPDPLRTDEDNKLRVVAEPLGFAAYLNLSLGAVREYVAADKIAAVHFLLTIELVARHCRRKDDLRALKREAENLLELSRTRLDGASRREVEREARLVAAALRDTHCRRPFPDFDGFRQRLDDLVEQGAPAGGPDRR